MRSSPSAIGSVLPLPACEGPLHADSYWARWTAGWRHVSAYRSARSALAALLAFHGIERVWLPAYACASLAQGARAPHRRWYGVDADLNPDLAVLATELKPGDAAVAVDYFGRPPSQAFRAFVDARPDILWIEDRAQALDPDAPVWGLAVIYSPRKLLGVGDGGLLLSQSPLPRPVGPARPARSGAQAARAADPDGRHPKTWYQAFQAQEAAFGVDDTPMSDETRAMLARAPIAPDIAARRRNAEQLRDALPDLALWPTGGIDYAPLAFPMRLTARDEVMADLAAAGIFCARHWAELPSDPEMFPDAHRLSRQILSAPCDPRYGPADMARIVESLRACQAKGAR